MFRKTDAKNIANSMSEIKKETIREVEKSYEDESTA